MASQVLCFLVLLTLITICKSKSCHPNDLKGLQDFKAGIHRDTSGRLSKWIGQDCCKWEGIFCSNETRRVVSMSLPGLYTSDGAPVQSAMIGELSPSITLVKFLEVIDIGELAGLTGKIPPLIGLHLPNLRKINFLGNKFTGALPETICKMTKLEELYLQENGFSGFIPECIGGVKNLRRMDVHSNKLSGVLPASECQQARGRDTVAFETWKTVFSELCKTAEQSTQWNDTFIDWLPDLTSETFTREISSLSNLQSLDLSFNHLNMSTIPKWLMQLPSLSRIYLAGCEIHGEIPDYIPKSLLELDLSANHLSGRIPAWIGSLSQLYYLNLSKNKFASEIPSTVTNLEILGVLDLHSNKLEGSVNAVFQIKSKFAGGSLTYLDLSDNSFSSGVEQIGKGGQEHIQQLNLSHNLLKGRLPTSIGTLKSLETLDLSYNGLSSNLPTSLANLTTLERLMLMGSHFLIFLRPHSLETEVYVGNPFLPVNLELQLLFT